MEQRPPIVPLGVVVACAVAMLAHLVLAQGAYLDPPHAEPGLAGFVAQVEFERETMAPPAPAGTPSPHGGAWFVPLAPSFALEPPWTTVVAVGQREGPGWRLTLRDHASVDVRVGWVSEQLLLVDVWWGRTVSSELLIDARRGELVHATTYAWYGAAEGEDAPPRTAAPAARTPSGTRPQRTVTRNRCTTRPSPVR